MADEPGRVEQPASELGRTDLAYLAHAWACLRSHYGVEEHIGDGHIPVFGARVDGVDDKAHLGHQTEVVLESLDLVGVREREDDCRRTQSNAGADGLYAGVLPNAVSDFA